MLLTGGAERTLEEYSALFARGFEACAVSADAHPAIEVIEAVGADAPQLSTDLRVGMMVIDALLTPPTRPQAHAMGAVSIVCCTGLKSPVRRIRRWSLPKNP
jgi:hypothetical protein